MLQTFLARNNSPDQQCGVWVNPKDIQDYKVGQYCFDNGACPEDWGHIGSLDDLSEERRIYTGEADGYAHIIRNHPNDSIIFQGKIVRYDRKGLAEAFSHDLLNPLFQEAIYEWLDEEFAYLSEEWAEQKIAELEEYFAPGGEYEQELEEMNREMEEMNAYMNR